ncbi:MAG: bifunctional phosphoglucose/phosphomannose isomerase [Methanobacteriota archaeon]|nr:MAG: bifunctional phosphoglucose/phosphomannose isomerase [Euryarchaeota archaeon]
MLDSLDTMRRLDTRDVLGMVSGMPDHLAEGLRLGRSREAVGERPDNVVICALGGSAIGGDLVSQWLSDRSDIPCHVSRGYHLPAYVGERSLVVAASYSGNTEETLSMTQEAVSRKARAIVISSGGKLEELAEAEGLAHCLVPQGMLPRATIGYLFGAIAGILDGNGVVGGEGDIASSIEVLRRVIADCAPEVDTAGNPAKKLAHHIHGTIPVIVGYGLSSPVARRWAHQLNENSKMLAFDCEVPEMNHNSIVGWMGDGRGGGFSMTFLDHDVDDERMRRRLEATKAMVADQVRVFSSHAVGDGTLERMFSLVAMGDYVSVYSAFLRKEDPSTTGPIDELKRILAKKGGGG